MTSDAVAIGRLLSASSDNVVTAESCTGGLIATYITEIAGASKWYVGGWVTYSNAMKKSQLNVPEELLQTYGAVSSQVAEAMCKGARKQSGATVALSTTGIAGPAGGTKEKPVGTVFVGCATESGIEVKRFLFTGNRAEVQEQTAVAALQLLHEKLL
jgi:PncC family amidohydrolase